MAFFSDLWDGIKNVGSSVLNVIGVIAGAIVDTVFWLIDKVFDAFEAVIDFVDWTFTKIGDWLSPKTDKGDIIILPNTPRVINIVDELEQDGQVKQGSKVKLSSGKAALQVLQSDGQVKKMVIAGSDKGFSSDINCAIKNGQLYKIPIEK